MKNETKWLIDLVHSSISFKLRHLMIAHIKCAFKNFDASIYTSNINFNSAEIDLWIDTSSINTGDAGRDKHLKSSDFLDVQNHKQITFTSSTIGKSDVNGLHELWGELSIKGISKKIKLMVEFKRIYNDSFGNEKAGFTVTGLINRKDWGITWNTTMKNGGLMVSDEVIISFEIELAKAGKRYLTMEFECEDKIMSLI